MSGEVRSPRSTRRRSARPGTGWSPSRPAAPRPRCSPAAAGGAFRPDRGASPGWSPRRTRSRAR